MLGILYVKQAEQDIFDIGCYIADRNPIAAEKLITKIYSVCEELRKFPFLGQSRDDVALGARHLVVDNYLIFYKVQDNAVYINRIIHTSRYLPELL
jgi:toxin ParE1/3/4